MKKNRKILAYASAVIAAVILICSFSFAGSAQYNDYTYRSYVNLSENSDIPSLFKNDSVFSAYKSHPPVISGGIEYVPLELFYGLSNVKISYSDDNSNFYIQNKKSNKYISFSINDKYAVTGTNNVYETDIPTFYGVRYVPLRIVCSSTGIGCSSYNDGENKIYAIKVYTVPGLSAQELLKIHAPGIYSPVPETDENDNNPGNENSTPETENGSTDTNNEPSTEPDNAEVQKPDADDKDIITQPETEKPDAGQDKQESEKNGQNTNTDDKTTTPVQKPGDVKPPKKEEPRKEEPQEEPKVKPGTVMLFYKGSTENASGTVDVLSDCGIKGTFFVTEKEILMYPDTIRKIYVYGHTLGITFDETAEELYEPGVLEEKTKSAENALYEITKSKTRIVYLPKPDSDLHNTDEINSRIDALGLCSVKLNGDSGTDRLDARNATSRMAEKLKDIPGNYGSDTAYISMSCTESGNATVGTIARFAKEHRQVKISLFDETLK